jgi:ABC-type phosphate transport system permease subunit
MGWLTALAAGMVVLPLLLIFGFLLYQGASAVNVEFFTQLPKPVGEVGGGMANAIVGTLILVGLASCLGLPLGILGGVYLAESRDRRLPWIARFLADVLNGVPSIVIGIFAYAVAVLPLRRFSALAGIPKPVVKQARKYLQLLEEASVSRGGQSDLFSKTIEMEEEPLADPVREELQKVNPDELTPREALELLDRLKKL